MNNEQRQRVIEIKEELGKLKATLLATPELDVELAETVAKLRAEVRQFNTIFDEQLRRNRRAKP